MKPTKKLAGTILNVFNELVWLVGNAHFHTSEEWVGRYKRAFYKWEKVRGLLENWVAKEEEK